MKRGIRRLLIGMAGIGMLALVCVTNLHSLWSYGFWANVSGGAVEGDLFRAMEFWEDGLTALEKAAQETGLEFSDAAAVVMTRYGFALGKSQVRRLDGEDILEWKRILENAEQSGYETIRTAYRAVLADIRYFPIPDSLNPNREEVTFADTWKEKRSYGGERFHEGTDLMGAAYGRGTYPVVAMTDGVVEKMGWLPMGGWRVGIRAPSGGYFYYAHLDSFAPRLQEGDAVRAGQLLGYMGDSGYGAEEGTVGNFPVHLHIGIYIQTEHREEMSVNPYPILRYAQKYKLNYDY